MILYFFNWNTVQFFFPSAFVGLASFLVDLAMPVINLLKLDQGVHLKATLRVFNREEKLFGPGKLALLQFIQEMGSISQAALSFAEPIF